MFVLSDDQGITVGLASAPNSRSRLGETELVFENSLSRCGNYRSTAVSKQQNYIPPILLALS